MLRIGTASVGSPLNLLMSACSCPNWDVILTSILFAGEAPEPEDPPDFGVEEEEKKKKEKTTSALSPFRTTLCFVAFAKLYSYLLRSGLPPQKR